MYPQIKGSAYFSRDAADLLFVDAKHNLEQIYAMLEQDESPKAFDLPMGIKLEFKSTHTSNSSPNVAAILEGSDPNH